VPSAMSRIPSRLNKEIEMYTKVSEGCDIKIITCCDWCGKAEGELETVAVSCKTMHFHSSCLAGLVEKWFGGRAFLDFIKNKGA